MRHSGNYEALHETHRQVDKLVNTPVQQETRYYGELRQTHNQVDAQRDEGPEPEPQRPQIQRGWSHHGGMVPQQGAANDWVRQNYESRMSDNQRSGESSPGSGRGENTQRNQNDPELQEARAAAEEARQREAAERSRTQERDRGPER